MDWWDELDFVRVGPYRIVVETMDPDESLALGEPAGFYMGEHCRIAIREDLDPDFAKETLLHEVLHACAGVANIGEDDVEERVIGALAPTLLDVLQRNPKLVRYLRRV